MRIFQIRYEKGFIMTKSLFPDDQVSKCNMLCYWELHGKHRKGPDKKKKKTTKKKKT